ncbi:hypothetical protein AcW1_009469 [Taiwanofungus camphoratus]|nr:hypothetical protein AcW1_009469 [Antrodia cinnamomea]
MMRPLKTNIVWKKLMKWRPRCCRLRMIRSFRLVLAQIYYFKPQTLSVSVLLLLILSYWFGNGLHMIFPWKGIFKWINPGPFNIKEHVAIIIMSSAVSTSAAAIQAISVQELYYNNNLNPGIAIFTLIESQLIGYGLRVSYRMFS